MNLRFCDLKNVKGQGSEHVTALFKEEAEAYTSVSLGQKWKGKKTQTNRG